MDKKVGEKIREFRKRAKMSQLQLEILIETSPGSISRIENGEVNPTKETIIKISNALNLSSLQSAELFGLEIINMEQLIKVISRISRLMSFEEVLETAANSLYNMLPGYNGGVIMLKDDKSSMLIAGLSLRCQTLIKS